MDSTDRHSRLLRGATALREGGIAEAIAALEPVLAAFPGDVDAMYLLGSARLSRGEFAVAVQLLDRVLERLPDAPHVRAARQRAADALGRRIVEHEVCQAALPRMRPHVAETPVAAVGAAHVVLATAAIDAGALALAMRAASALALPQPTFWLEPRRPLRAGPAAPIDAAAAARATTIDSGRGSFPREGLVVFVGAARSPAAWWPRCAPTMVALVVDEFAPCEILERIRELGGDGARRIALWYADAAVARRARLPGGIVPGPG